MSNSENISDGRSEIAEADGMDLDFRTPEQKAGERAELDAAAAKQTEEDEKAMAEIRAKLGLKAGDGSHDWSDPEQHRRGFN